MDYITSFGQSEQPKEPSAASKMSSQDFDDTDKIIQENIKSVNGVENDDNTASNNNDKLYRDDISAQIKVDTQ